MAKKASNKVASKETKGKQEKQVKKQLISKEPREKKQKRAKKDKNAPKRAISAFFFFQKSRRETLKKEQPILSNKEMISKMSQEWNSLSSSQKEPYGKQAEKDKVRYQNEMKGYNKKAQAHPIEAKKHDKKGSGAAKGKKAKKEESEEEGDDEEEVEESQEEDEE